jgi:hypothetical protein
MGEDCAFLFSLSEKKKKKVLKHNTGYGTLKGEK